MNRLFVAALNGGRSRAEHQAVPLTPAELAAEAARVAAAGATEVHIHPRRADGTESLEADDIAAAVQAIRMAVPGVRVSVSTGAWIEPNPRRRVRLIDAWTVIPTSATVNVHEEGAVEVAKALARRGVAVEAGIFTVLAAEQFVAGPMREIAARVLIEPVDRPAVLALHDLESIGHVLDRYRIRAPRLIHGENESAWPILQRALELGAPTRTGLEDTLCLPDGTAAPDNTYLVRAALG